MPGDLIVMYSTQTNTHTVDQTKVYKFLGKKASGEDGGATARWKMVVDRVNNSCPGRPKSMQRNVAACRSKYQQLLKLGLGVKTGKFNKYYSGRQFKDSVIVPAVLALMSKIEECASDQTRTHMNAPHDLPIFLHPVLIRQTHPMTYHALPSLSLPPTPNGHNTGKEQGKEQTLLDKITDQGHKDEMAAMAAEMAAKAQGAVLRGARKRKVREGEEKDGEEDREGKQGGGGDGESEGSSQEGKEKKKMGKKGKGRGLGAPRACKGRAELARYGALTEALAAFGKQEKRRIISGRSIGKRGMRGGRRSSGRSGDGSTSRMTGSWGFWSAWSTNCQTRTTTRRRSTRSDD